MKRVSFIQIGDSFGHQRYLPYSVGLLQAYAQFRLSDPEMFRFGLPLYSKMPPVEAVNYLAGSDLLCFSVYVWNFALSREIARLYKEINPDAVIVFGGPQVPESRQGLLSLMEKNPFIDIACYTEGEEPFLKILEQLEYRSWDKVPGIAFRRERRVLTTEPAAQIDDLDLIPSPYLSGVFDRLLEDNPDVKWSALMETNRGCPFTCAFCYWGAGERQRIRRYSIERVHAELEWFARHQIEFVFCCDANFGILPRDMHIAQRVAKQKERSGYPGAFSVQSTKNSTGRILALQKLLNDAGLQKGVNLALQSLHQPTLTAIQRSNITSDTYCDLLSIFNKAGIPAFSDLILGLPEETYDSYTAGVEQVIRHGQHNRIQFINLTILENTAMADPAYIQRYGLQIVDSLVVAHHTSLTGESGVDETQRLVVGTAAMPLEDWVKARVFSWFVALFYFNRLLQIPLLLLDRLTGTGIREIFSHFVAHRAALPLMGSILAVMRDKAQQIQVGKPEYLPAPDHLHMWWPLDEYILISLIEEKTLDQLYEEASRLMAPFESRLPEKLLDEALHLNRLLIKEPFVDSDGQIELSYAIPELYASLKNGEETLPIQGSFHYVIDRTSQRWSDWESWMREMVWYGGKKGDYLYPCRPGGHEVAAL